MSATTEHWSQRLGRDVVTSWGDIAASTPAVATATFDAETPVVRPTDLDGLQEAMRFASAQQLRVLPAGALEHLAWGAALDRVDVVVSSQQLNRIVEYEPGDLTLTAQAGATLHDIESRAHAHQQRLAPDSWPGTAATVGGACAAQRFGLSRLRYGTFRDAVLGARVVHADGTTTRTGGRVVKNVTGYDLAKIYVGSQGSLVFIAELHLRLIPRPHATALVHAALPFEEARQRVWELHASDLQPVAIVVTNRFANDAASDSPDDESPAPASEDVAAMRVHVLVRFEGRAPVVEQQASVCKRQLGGRILSAAREPWDALRQFTALRPGGQLVQASAPPTSVFDAIAGAVEHVDAGVEFVGLFGVGTTWLRTHDCKREALGSWYEKLPRGWHVRVLADTSTTHLGTLPAAALQRALKSTFDPQGLLRDLHGAVHEVAP